MNLHTATDEQLAVAYQESRDGKLFEELLKRHHGIICTFANQIFKRNDFDSDDALQETRISFYEAVLSYDPSKSSFYTFYPKVLQRRTRDLMTYLGRKKRRVDNLVSLNQPSPMGDDEFGDLLPSPVDVEKVITNAEKAGFLFSKGTYLERHSVFLAHCGYDYYEIAGMLGTHKKAVDNAIQRMRRKAIA